MKIIIDVKEDLKPTADDVIYFDGNHWIVGKKCVVFSDELQKIHDFEIKIKELEEIIAKNEENIKYMAQALKENIE